MFGGHTDIGIDLGTANILVYVKGKGIVLKEPSVVAVEKAKNKILAVGSEAASAAGLYPSMTRQHKIHSSPFFHHFIKPPPVHQDLPEIVPPGVLCSFSIFIIASYLG